MTNHDWYLGLDPSERARVRDNLVKRYVACYPEARDSVRANTLPDQNFLVDAPGLPVWSLW